MTNDSKSLKRFGRYLLLDHLVDGGMAQIYRARFLGEQADKIVAVKMIRNQYSGDENFKKMFMDEIKVTFDLIHPNIIQTYDYGMENGTLFVAMEYCDGKNLQEYLKELKAKGFIFPISICVNITSQICRALEYAHTKVDQLTGTPANIIHRDISPHNVMLSYDGAVKVIDFGIAKAHSNADSTQAGTIKGKLSYLAPEYLEGLELDPRYDEFATAIVLWEMLTGRKLFKSDSDLAVLKQIQNCKILPPSKVNPNIPKELDQIVLKALSRDRELRYKSLDHFDRALTKFLFQAYPNFGASDLGYFAKQLFREDIKKNKEKLQEFGKIDIGPYLDDIKRKEGNDTSKDSPKEKSGLIKKAEQELDFGFEDEKSKKFKLSDIKKDSTEVNKKTSNEDFTMGTSSGGTLKIDDPGPRDTKTLAEKEELRENKIKEKREIKYTEKLVTKELSKPKETSKKLLVAGIVLVAIYFGNNYLGQKKRGQLALQNKVEKKGRKPASDKSKKDLEKGELILSNYDNLSHRVFFDGDLVKPDVFGAVSIIKGKEVTLRVKIKGHESFVKTIKLSSDEKRLRMDIPETKPAKFAYLITGMDCVEGELYFSMYGEKRKEFLPIKNRRGVAFPLHLGPQGNIKKTTYELVFKSSGRSVKRKIKVTFRQENDTVDFCKALFK